MTSDELSDGVEHGPLGEHRVHRAVGGDPGQQAVYNEGTPTGKPDGKSYLYVHLRARSEALPITQYCSPFALDLPSGSSVDRVAGGCVRLDSGTTTETVAAFTLPIGADR